MATIQIRDIPEEVYETLRGRARDAGQSLQSYMREHVVSFGSRPTKAEMLSEWFRELDENPTSVTTTDIVRDLHEARAERDAELDDRMERFGRPE